MTIIREMCRYQYTLTCMVSLEESCRRECFGLDNLKRQQKYHQKFMMTSVGPGACLEFTCKHYRTQLISHKLQVLFFFVKEYDNE